MVPSPLPQHWGLVSFVEGQLGESCGMAISKPRFSLLWEWAKDEEVKVLYISKYPHKDPSVLLSLPKIHH